MPCQSLRSWLAPALLAVPLMVVAGTATAAAAAPAPPAAAHAAKPVPEPPPSSPGAGPGAAITAKPHQAGAPAPLPGSWSVTLTASPSVLWPTQYSTLTATANMNVGPTPYYLRIYDETAQAYVWTCSTGSTCTTAVTEPTATTHEYIAVVSYFSTSYPPPGEVAASGVVSVLWQGVSLSLSASPATLPVGSVTTLTATTSADIGPSPFWTQIYDATTHSRLMACGSGTSCTATVSEAVATTHEFIAYVSNYTAAYPPTGIQATSQASYVTWSNLGWRVSLSAPAVTYGPETVIATANGNVGPTPYYIDIFNETTGTELASCGFGSACSVTFTPSPFGSTLVAFIGYGAGLPPAVTAASSNTVTSYLRIIP